MNEREQAILDRLAFEFESAWRRGETPAIEMFLDRVPKHLRLPLARLLFPIEINCRMQAGQVAELSLWQNLGQEFAAIAAEVLLDRTLLHHPVPLMHLQQENSTFRPGKYAIAPA
jgi:hypothetical protein